jgi:dCMP deaminase
MVTFDHYYMLVAVTVRERANCKGRKVGAIIVKDNRIIGTGYNGTPEGMTNCEDGGCVRCDQYHDSGELYDKCICVHAEQNAIVAAARFGHSIQGSIIYTTLQPCFSCLKELLQAKVETVYYLEEINKAVPESERERNFFEQYDILSKQFNPPPIKIDAAKLKDGAERILQYIKQLSDKKI